MRSIVSTSGAGDAAAWDRQKRRKTMASAKATIDHDEIRRWVEERGGYPAHVKRSGDEDDPGILRIDYPGFSGQGTLERISCDEFFDASLDHILAIIHYHARESP